VFFVLATTTLYVCHDLVWEAMDPFEENLEYDAHVSSTGSDGTSHALDLSEALRAVWEVSIESTATLVAYYGDPATPSCFGPMTGGSAH
jgi:hypothetical protein